MGPIGLDLHSRPNSPIWQTLDPELILETATSSRTGIEGILRPRDDLHALILAMHAWKAGFTRLRDLHDTVLLAATSSTDVADTAEDLGLGRFWRWTMKITDTLLTDRRAMSPSLARLILPRNPGRRDHRRVRVVSPLLVTSPVQVARGLVTEYRIGQRARSGVSRQGRRHPDA